MAAPRIVITGTGAICGSGRTPAEILAAINAGTSAVRPIAQWDAGHWPVRIAAEVPDYNAGALTGDRKLLKFMRPRISRTGPASSSVPAAGTSPISTTTSR